MSRKVTASPAEVRAWATENGLTVGTRGKLPPEVIKGYNDSHKVKYVQAAFVQTRKITGTKPDKNGRNRSVTVTATTAEVRDAAVQAGLAKPGRGRLSNEVFAAFAAGKLTN